MLLHVLRKVPIDFIHKYVENVPKILQKCTANAGVHIMRSNILLNK